MLAISGGTAVYPLDVMLTSTLSLACQLSSARSWECSCDALRMISTTWGRRPPISCTFSRKKALTKSSWKPSPTDSRYA